jgi:Oxidoreductase molybdopterin binding domain
MGLVHPIVVGSMARLCGLAAAARRQGRAPRFVLNFGSKGSPQKSQITELTCEEGWCYIAEWIGTPLSYVLEAIGILPQAKFVVYYSIDQQWESVNVADAVHPKTAAHPQPTTATPGTRGPDARDLV